MSRTLNRANSDLLAVKMIAEDTRLGPVERMAAIAAVVRRYQQVVEFTPNNLPGDSSAQKMWPYAYTR